MMTIERLDADVLISGAVAYANKIGEPMCIAVTDDSGDLIAFKRMDGARITSSIIAIDKAFTASAARKATHEYGEASQPGAPAYGIASALGGRFMVVGGGLPVLVDDAVVGGIGVSSGSPDQDRAVAQAGINYFLKQRHK